MAIDERNNNGLLLGLHNASFNIVQYALKDKVKVIRQLQKSRI